VKEVNVMLLLFFVRFHAWLGARIGQVPVGARTRCPRPDPAKRPDPRPRQERGQTTAEYALVILAAAAIAIVLIAWARSSGKLPAFFDKIIDDITNSAQ
jgi:Flp pilus assembly pilin Flp